MRAKSISKRMSKLAFFRRKARRSEMKRFSSSPRPSPTKHLDLEVLLWFQEYLKGYPGGILMISHDREFLNQLVGSIIEIRQSKLVRYRGNYEDFLQQREAAEVQLLAAYNNQQREIAH